MGFFLLMDIQTGWQDGRMGKMAQQHPDLPEGSARPSPGRTVLGLFIAGSEAICFLISWAILMKACSSWFLISVSLEPEPALELLVLAVLPPSEPVTQALLVSPPMLLPLAPARMGAIWWSAVARRA